MKKYYIHYYRDSRNTYNLFWADTPAMEAALPEGAERITRRQAEALCREEQSRRQYDPAFSGYASSCIFPADYDFSANDIRNDLRYALRGFVWDRC